MSSSEYCNFNWGAIKKVGLYTENGNNKRFLKGGCNGKINMVCFKETCGI